MNSGLILVIAYLIGALPIGLGVGKLVRGIDVREFGSGNIGASNVWRTLGPTWGVLVFLMDVAKGLLPTVVAHRHSGGPVWLPVATGIAAILGHNFSPFLRFKGGKGVATTLGVAFGLSWQGALIGFALWGLILALTRYISVASMIGVAVGSFCIWQFNAHGWPYGLFAILATVFVVFTHRANIARLRAGTERRVREKIAESAAPPQVPNPMTAPRLFLASTSPRRRELLGALGLPFEVVASRYDEDQVSPGGLTPPEYVTRLAAGKALDVAARTGGHALVIGADTTVILDGEFLNKPRDPTDARRMLRRLSGRTHQVYTGLCVLSVTDGTVTNRLCDHAATDVTFDDISDETITRYVATGEPLDKAGAYGIQGKALAFIPGIRGDYFNVVGLPLNLLGKMLTQLDVSLW